MKVVDRAGGDECRPAHRELISRTGPGERVEVEYFKNEEASRKKTRGGWVAHGDMCHCDENGWFYFDFRRAAAFAHNGDFVNPGFVEKVIAEHPQVDDVFVYGCRPASVAGESDIVRGRSLPVDADAFDPTACRDCVRGLERLRSLVPAGVGEIPDGLREPQERFLMDRFAPDAAAGIPPLARRVGMTTVAARS